MPLHVSAFAADEHLSLTRLDARVHLSLECELRSCEPAKLRTCEAANLRSCEPAKLRTCETAKLRNYEPANASMSLPRRDSFISGGAF
jgi:hypothetical protein